MGRRKRSIVIASGVFGRVAISHSIVIASRAFGGVAIPHSIVIASRAFGGVAISCTTSYKEIASSQSLLAMTWG
ncbi:MAG TPA: hypothetical protein VGE21_04405 [Flavobacteriales bacterium]